MHGDVYRKYTTMVSQVFTLLGAGCSCACVAASAPELLMLGRVLVGINSGPSSLDSTCCSEPLVGTLLHNST